MSNRINIYGQVSYHDDVVIKGNKEGLLALKEAIESTLENNKTKSEVLFDSEGEGYCIIVSMLSTEEMDKLESPVTLSLKI